MGSLLSGRYAVGAIMEYFSHCCGTKVELWGSGRTTIGEKILNTFTRGGNKYNIVNVFLPSDNTVKDNAKIFAVIYSLYLLIVYY